MYIANEKCFDRTVKEDADVAAMLLETFNRSDADEHSRASDYIYDLYNLGNAFFRIRTMMAKGPESIRHDWLLRRGVSLARRNALERFPRLFDGRFVNEGFNALEALFDLTGDGETQQKSGARIKALAVSHFFQNNRHNIYVGSRFGLLDLDRALEQRPDAPISPTQNPD